MDHAIHSTSESPCEVAPFANIPLNEGNRMADKFSNAVNRHLRAVAQVVEDNHFVPKLAQRNAGMAANIAGATTDQNLQALVRHVLRADRLQLREEEHISRRRPLTKPCQGHGYLLSP